MNLDNKPLISIIVPVYNVEQYLQRCVDSILEQTYIYLDIILVDDGSTDSSGKICDEYQNQDKRITVIHKANGGLSSARNTGIENSKGQYLGFIDSDDWIDPRMYEILLKNMMDYNADVSDVDSVTIAEYGWIQNQHEHVEVKDGKELLKDYFLSDRYSVCRKLYKKEVIGNVRFPVGKINEDISTNYRFLENASKVVKSNLKMYYYFSNPDSITGTVFKEKDFDLLDACSDLLGEASKDSELKKYAELKMAISYYSLLGRYIAYPHSDIGNLNEKIKSLHKNLRREYPKILRSHISMKKKFMIFIVAVIDPKILKILHSVVKR